MTTPCPTCEEHFTADGAAKTSRIDPNECVACLRLKVQAISEQSFWEEKESDNIISKQSDQIRELRAALIKEQAARMVEREALNGLLSNIALDWWVNQFAKDTSPSPGSSGIIAHIHNADLVERVSRSLDSARKALKEPPPDLESCVRELVGALNFVVDDCACDRPTHYDRAKEALASVAGELERMGIK